MNVSNIDIRSNIFIRTPESFSGGDLPELDERFTAHIADKNALVKLREHAESNSLELHLTKAQEKLLGEKPCKFSTNGEVTHGLVYENGELAYECRCSKEDCPRAVKCGRLSAVSSDDALTEEEDKAPSDMPETLAQTSAEVSDENAPAETIPDTKTLDNETPEEKPSASTELSETDVRSLDNSFCGRLSALAKISVEELAAEGETVGVLCRNDCEAEYVSGLLWRGKTANELVREGGAALERSIADVLWDHGAGTISREVFVKRCMARCGYDEERADALFKELCGFAGGNSDVLDCELFAEKLRGGKELPTALWASEDGGVTVASVPRVKGRTFDRVYLFGFDGEVGAHEEELFGLAEKLTKNGITLLKKSGDGELVENSLKRGMLVNGGKCEGVCVGKAGDVEMWSFVEGTPAEAIKRQAYISQNVKRGAEVTLRLVGGRYEIICGDIVIGRMSDVFSESLLGVVDNGQPLSRLPDTITGLIAANVVTVVSRGEPSGTENVTEQFVKKRFRFGVEISGVAVRGKR